MSDAAKHAAVDAKWREFLAVAKESGTPFILGFYDGPNQVVPFGSPQEKKVYIHSGDFNPDKSGAGEILVSFDTLTLARMLPTLMHALNVANGLTVEDDEAPEPEPRDE